MQIGMSHVASASGRQEIANTTVDAQSLLIARKNTQIKSVPRRIAKPATPARAMVIDNACNSTVREQSPARRQDPREQLWVIHLSNGRNNAQSHKRQIGAERKKPKLLRRREKRSNPPVRRQVDEPCGVERE